MFDVFFLIFQAPAHFSRSHRDAPLMKYLFKMLISDCIVHRFCGRSFVSTECRVFRKSQALLLAPRLSNGPMALPCRVPADLVPLTTCCFFASRHLPSQSKSSHLLVLSFTLSYLHLHMYRSSSSRLKTFPLYHDIFSASHFYLVRPPAT